MPSCAGDSMTSGGGASEILGDEYDATQTEMMDEQVILVDLTDKVLGSMSKVDSHLGEGHLHRAFSVHLFDTSGRLLIQKRALSKITFPGIWANSCCSHPLHIDGEVDTLDGAKRAAIRKMEQELGIDGSLLSIDDFTLVGRMHYRARADEKWVEHELDHILFIQKDLELKPNPNEIEEIRWVNQKELEEMISGAQESGELIAPWFLQINERYVRSWWGCLEDPTAFVDLEVQDAGDVTERKDSLLLTALEGHRSSVEKKIINALGKSEHQRLSNAMMHLIEGGGKRLRSIMPFLVGDACGGASEAHYDLGAAIEIIHNFTLVHDDIMDNDEVRRGRPAVHIAFDNATAINAGDAMLALSFEMLSEADSIDSNHFRTLVQIIGKMVRKVSEGQQMDMDFENRKRVTEDEYIQMISGKTAAMFTTCGRTGALLAGAEQETIELMADWGENLGLCFQLMDDLIDATSDSETLGKPARSDVVEGKMTLIAIHALEQDPSILTTFHQVFGSQDETVGEEALNEVLNELLKSGSIEYAKQRAMEYHSKAHKCLDQLPQSLAVAVLRELTDWQLIRMY